MCRVAFVDLLFNVTIIDLRIIIVTIRITMTVGIYLFYVLK